MQVSHKYKERNEERIRDNHRRYCAKKRKHDPMYRILANLRSRISCALKNGYKSNRTETLIGCSILQLADHLSEHFQPGMSMENYGQWHVDHKTPCAFFDLSKSTQQRKCFNYTNLQPLWAKDNLRKGSKLLYEVTK